MIAPAIPLVQASGADSSTDGWRLIGLIAITLLTIVILALIFRPSTRRPETFTGPVSPNGDESGAEPARVAFGTAQPESVRPFPEHVPTDDSVAAERLRQIMSRVAGTEAAGQPRVGEPRPGERGIAHPHEPDTERRNGDEVMDTSDHGTIPEHDADQAGLDAAAFEEQINRLFGLPGEPGKIVPFTPRKTPPQGDREPRTTDRTAGAAGQPRATGQERPLTQFPVDMATREGITSTIQELLFCANVGELLHGFALYTDRYLFQFLDESRMSEDEFREAYSDIPAKDPSDWTRIDTISDFERMEDGRVSVRVRYIDGAEVDGTERFIMRLDTHLERWLIDDIRAE